jgi:hypothetical protein
MRPQAELVDGWICVPYPGSDLQRVELSLDQSDPQAAFLDWHGDQRVAKLRPAAFDNPYGDHTISLHIDGQLYWSGRLTI